MDLKAFKTFFKQLVEVDKTASELQLIGSKIHWTGIVGSSGAICASAVAEQTPGNHVFILEDKEMAAYFLNDLEGLYPERNNIVFYPASYRVPYELEKTDNTNVVARAEVLEKVKKVYEFKHFSKSVY